MQLAHLTHLTLTLSAGALAKGLENGRFSPTASTTTIAKILEESGLGLTDEAYGFVISALRDVKKKPGVHRIFPRPILENVLWWAYSLSDPTHRRAALSDIGDFYGDRIAGESARHRDSMGSRESGKSSKAIAGLVPMLDPTEDPYLDEREVVLSPVWTGMQIAKAKGYTKEECIRLEAPEVQRFEDIPFSENSTGHWIELCNPTMLGYLLNHPNPKFCLNSPVNAGRTLLSWAAESDSTLAQFYCELVSH
ncbi:hypothetical protein HYFRA_00008687 [Hymenoscyphus fraxineus]|uniref:Uncharacterized protein n=1 Tax=Hymenoscyphus fraxineus TaxID=746836 RepID=A0A9N9PTX4_9HELO|nr:hypothetical protein HYFRA_00008687 [Hymenoscyphus fraxineus]